MHCSANCRVGENNALESVGGEALDPERVYTVCVSAHLLRTEENSNMVMRDFVQSQPADRRPPTEEEGHESLLLLKQYFEELKERVEKEGVDDALQNLVAGLETPLGQGAAHLALEPELADFQILKWNPLRINWQHCIT